MNKVGIYFSKVFASIGDILNLSPFKIERVKYDKEFSYKSDEEALRSDWEVVGEELRKVMNVKDDK
ncbi:hypothetical protein [Sporosarcina sp. FSL W7-1283]|uniref:hypothetical protein n=1 Tax=Sporosarcina sp. FSL W7-1283 TaxID=2921560 RepID=UPI0030F6F512